MGDEGRRAQLEPWLTGIPDDFVDHRIAGARLAATQSPTATSRLTAPPSSDLPSWLRARPQSPPSASSPGASLVGLGFATLEGRNAAVIRNEMSHATSAMDQALVAEFGTAELLGASVLTREGQVKLARLLRSVGQVDPEATEAARLRAGVDPHRGAKVEPIRFTIPAPPQAKGALSPPDGLEPLSFQRNGSTSERRSVGVGATFRDTVYRSNPNGALSMSEFDTFRRTGHARLNEPADRFVAWKSISSGATARRAAWNAQSHFRREHDATRTVKKTACNATSSYSERIAPTRNEYTMRRRRMTRTAKDKLTQSATGLIATADVRGSNGGRTEEARKGALSPPRTRRRPPPARERGRGSGRSRVKGGRGDRYGAAASSGGFGVFSNHLRELGLHH